MLMRTSVIASTLLLGLASVPGAFGQPPERGRGRDGLAVDLPALVRRVAELEKQVETLNKEMEALRKDGKAPAPAPASAAPTASSSGGASAPAPEVKTQVRIFILREADVTDIAKTLVELYRGDNSKSVRIAPNKSTNSLVIRCRPDEIDEIEGIVTRLELAAGDTKKARADSKGEAKSDTKR
jgi:hypothetical protein